MNRFAAACVESGIAKFSTISVIAVVAVALTGCGGGSSSPNTTTTNSSGGAKAPGTSFSVVVLPGVGRVLADARGRTVYVLTKPGMQNVPCTDASGCTAVWPDLPLPDGTKHATAGAEVNAMILGTMKVGNETYPTYNGYLMYEYASDTGPRQTNGQGITSYGGTWYVINPSGKPTKTGTSGGGYHY